MRWIWIDRILELDKGRRCVAIKNMTRGEDVLHDHFAAADGQRACAVMPNTLIIEGFAQTAGILVAYTGDFREKVILAKIGKADFVDAARPGYTLRFTADIERIDASGASTSGTVELLDPAGGQARPLARIELMFSHIDKNRAGLAFPEHNFVMTDLFMQVLRDSGLKASPADEATARAAARRLPPD